LGARRCVVADGASPAVERRRLALELRRLRTEARKTIYDVADRLECSAGKVSRIEMGIVGARIQDVREMLDLYEVRGERRDQLLELVRRSRRRAWWQDFAGVVPPESAKLFGLEAGAATIDDHSVALVPGLLQIDEYARAIISSPPDEKQENVDRRIELRKRRQELLDRGDPPEIRFLLHQAVVDALIGSPATMAAQLRHLVDMASREHVTLRVIRSDAGAYAAVGVSFTAFGFAHEADPKIVFLEQLTRNTFVEDPVEVDLYTKAFDSALDIAETPQRSRELILRRAGELG
jgi:transcriptional regulator with XRE-family HTH domain